MVVHDFEKGKHKEKGNKRKQLNTLEEFDMDTHSEPDKSYIGGLSDTLCLSLFSDLYEMDHVRRWRRSALTGINVHE